MCIGGVTFNDGCIQDPMAVSFCVRVCVCLSMFVCVCVCVFECVGVCVSGGVGVCLCLWVCESL